MRAFRFIFLSSFLFAIHLALISYVNSTTLEQFVKEDNVSVFFIAASIISIVVMSVASKILRAIGNVRFSAILFLLSIISLLVMSTSTEAKFVLPAFILYFSINVVIVYCFDLFIEHYSSTENTGKIRGSYLALNNLAWVSMPLISGIIISKYGIQSVYGIASIIIAIICTVVLLSQNKFKDKKYLHENIFAIFHKIQKDHNVKDIVIIAFILQIFYSIMVIYSPLYLHNVQNFSWKEIGIMFGIMLTAFPLVQYPAGRLADKFGEKNFLIAGLTISAFAIMLFAWVPTFINLGLVGFAAILFFSRVGAATIEVMCDTYFFKGVTEKETGVISAYRIIAPLGYIFGPIISILILNFSSYTVLFTFLAILLGLGVYFATKIKES